MAASRPSDRLDPLKRVRRLKACPSVPSMGRILLDERSQPEPMTATVAKPQGVTARPS